MVKTPIWSVYADRNYVDIVFCDDWYPYRHWYLNTSSGRRISPDKVLYMSGSLEAAKEWCVHNDMVVKNVIER